MKLRCIIVEDEPLARNLITDYVSKVPYLELVEACSNPMRAMEVLKENQVDLMFLDIQMPGKNGFDLLEDLEHNPAVIFVTAYDEYALRAFEVNALDYLLKPVDPVRLSEALSKIEEEIKEEERQVEEARNRRLGQEDQVFLKDGDKCWYVALSEVRKFESEGNYVRVHFGANKPLILKSLNNLEARLDNQTFFRANRKFIVNLRWVTEVENWFSGGLQLKLKNGDLIEVSRRQASRFKDIMTL